MMKERGSAIKRKVNRRTIVRVLVDKGQRVQQLAYLLVFAIIDIDMILTRLHHAILFLLPGVLFGHCAAFIAMSEGEFEDRIIVTRNVDGYLYADLDKPPGPLLATDSAREFADSSADEILNYRPTGRWKSNSAFIVARRWVWRPADFSAALAREGQIGHFRPQDYRLALSQSSLDLFAKASFSPEITEVLPSGYDYLVRADVSIGEEQGPEWIRILSAFTLYVIPWRLSRNHYVFRVRMSDRSGFLFCDRTVAIKKATWISAFFVVAPWAWSDTRRDRLRSSESMSSVMAFLIESCPARAH